MNWIFHSNWTEFFLSFQIITPLLLTRKRSEENEINKYVILNFSFHCNQTSNLSSWVPFDVSVIFGMLFLIITTCNSRGGGSTVVCTMYNIFKYSRRQKTDNFHKKWRVKHISSSFSSFPSIWITNKRNICCNSRTSSNACKHYIQKKNSFGQFEVYVA